MAQSLRSAKSAGGGSAAFAYGTGIALRNRHLLTPEMQQLLLDIDFHFDKDASCGVIGTYGTLKTGGDAPKWRRGNTCMDDYTVGALGEAWHAAFLRAVNDSGWEGKRNAAIDDFVKSFDTSESICIRAPTITPSFAPRRGPTSTTRMAP